MTEGERLQLKIGRLFHKALRDYRLIDDGDKVLDDGIHPDGKGAAKMADIIATALKAQ